ncbi:Protein of unknown function DUF3405 [Penicillium capsulatum]|nr:Protein of unknown function DUF3405 [Penicillium capsulatum]
MRQYFRFLLVAVTLSTVLFLVFIHPPYQPVVEASLEERRVDNQAAPQEPIHPDISQQGLTPARQFLTFISTLAKLPLEKSWHPQLSDDPRLNSGPGTGPIPKIYRPYPDYQSQEWKQSHRGTFKPCMGPRGKLLPDSLDDQVGAYIGTPKGFPRTLFGSHEAVGWDGEISFDRYTRYGAYGLGENEKVANWARPSKVKWEKVDWGNLQAKCVADNADRYEVGVSRSAIPPEARTVVLIRTYTGKQYSDNDMINIRAMITELTLQSGGQYEVILLVHVKDDAISLEDERERLLQENVPREFWGIARFWKMATEVAGYPELNPELMDVHHSQWLPIQDFMKKNPQFEYAWNWEIDSRFTGHYYEFADRTAKFGREQPRRGIWERSERFYIPRYHGDYEQYREFVNRQDPAGAWGPMPMWAAQEDGQDAARSVQGIKHLGPSPPVPVATQDNFEWGVGEEADLMTFLPIFNPINTEWVIRYEVFGYIGRETPRRAALITHCRLSRRLLMAMDNENRQGRHMSAELFHVSTAFLHGFKGLTVPHPVYSDRLMPGNRISRWFNSGVNGRSGNTNDSPFSWGRESRFKDVSWYYRANLPGRLYWNFLGWEKGGTGGPKFEKINGRHCLPSILFHPVKDVYPESDSIGYDFDSDLGSQAAPEALEHLQ